MDYSETSFQIPTDFGDEPSRLNDMEFDFDAFDDSGGLDCDPLTTPLHKTKKHAPLTLEDLTPRVEGALNQPQSEVSSPRTAEATQSQTQKDPNISVRPPPPKKAPVDDFFERRKRDNYLQMGLDLSVKSTARYRHDRGLSSTQEIQLLPEIPTDEPMNITPQNVLETPMNDSIATSEEAAPVPMEISVDTQVKNGPKGKRSSILGTWEGITKQKSPPASTVSISRPKPILKRAKKATLSPSNLAGPIEKASPILEPERSQRGDITQETPKKKRRESTSSLVAFGGGLIDVLITYGEKLRGSFGFSSSTKSTRGGTVATEVIPDLTEARYPGSLDMDTTTTDLLTFSSRTPARSHADDILTVSQLSPSKVMDEKQSVIKDTQLLPIRSSTKRPATSTLPREKKKGKTDENAVPQSSTTGFPNKRNEQKSRSKTGSISNKLISRPRPLGISQNTNRASKTGSISKSSCAGGSISSGGSKDKKPNSSNHSREGPLFASDVYRQVAAEKLQKENKDSIRDRSHKPGAISQFPKPAPPARPMVRPVIPTGFIFQSDARISQRHSEFEEKKESWEKRTSRERLPVPDFASMHSIQEEGARKKRLQRSVIPEAPVLTTMIRAKEREKFDEQRREREKELQKLRELREKERAEQEEKEYREARKKTVIRAHEVPEWYREMPKRKAAE